MEADNQFEIMGGSDTPETKEVSDIAKAGETTKTDSGSSQSTSGNGQTGSNLEAAEWTKQLSREIRDGEAFGKLTGFKTISELAQAYIQSGSAPVDVSKLDYEALFKNEEFWRTLGVPKPDEPYGIEGKALKGFVESARENNLTKKQAENIANYLEAALNPAVNEGVKKQIEATTLAVVEETKKQFPAIAERLKAEFGQDAALYYNKAAKGIIDQLRSSGLGANLQVSRALCALGRETSEEDSGASRTRRSGGTPKTYAEGGKMF